MKLDREKFLAAALLLGAASVATGCSKSSSEPAPVKDEAAPRPSPVQVQPPTVIAPNKEGVVIPVPPAKEGGAVAPPAGEGITKQKIMIKPPAGQR